MDYIQGPGSGNAPGRAAVLGGQGFGFEPKTDEDVKLAVAMMAHNGKPHMQASPTMKCGLTAGHGILAWDPTQRADQDEMLNAGRHFLKTLGMGNAMAVFTKHNDKPRGPHSEDGPHMHMGVSMIDPKTGLTFSRYQLLYKGQHAALQWEIDNGQVTPSRQPQHDLANAAAARDFKRLQYLLHKDDGKISGKQIDHAFAMGGQFGPHMAAAGAAFRKYLGEEPARTRTQEQPEPKQERPAPARDEERRKPTILRHFEGPQKGQVGRGDLEDRTDQTAEGRAYIKRNRDKSRGLSR